MRFREALDERGLPDTGLAADKHEAAIACGHLVEDRPQLIEELFALEQFHSF